MASVAEMSFLEDESEDDGFLEAVESRDLDIFDDPIPLLSFCDQEDDAEDGVEEDEDHRTDLDRFVPIFPISGYDSVSEDGSSPPRSTILDSAEEIGSDFLQIKFLGRGSGSGVEEEGHGIVIDGDDSDNAYDDDGGMIWDRNGGRQITIDSADDNFDVGGLREVGFDLDSDSEEDRTEIEISHEGAGVSDRGDDGELDSPIYCDCLRIEDEPRGLNNDFEWEEVEGRDDERAAPSMAADLTQGSAAPADVIGDESDEEGTASIIEWQVLLSMNNIDRIPPLDDADEDSFFGDDHDDYVYTSEHDDLFGQFVEQEVSIKGIPPAAKSVMENLPAIVLTRADAESHNNICAVCREEMPVGKCAKQLPCLHYYHGECILPWLAMRNTCPVCRHELPSDDTTSDNLREWRSDGGMLSDESRIRYIFEMLPEV